MRITEFGVRGLKGRYNYKIPVKDNKFVLVGVNGSGKTTLVNMLFAFLTRQWEKLLDYEFEEIYIKVPPYNKKYGLKRGDLFEDIIDANEDITENSSVARDIEHLRSVPGFWRAIKKGPISYQEIKKLSFKTGISINRLKIIVERFRSLQGEDLFSHGASEVYKFLEGNVDGQIMYLPTYRRIEQDLKELLPANPDGRYGQFLEDFEEQGDTSKEGYIELVKFGMSDVERNISRFMTNLSTKANREYSNLTGDYLQDIIKGKADKPDISRISDLDDTVIEKVLGGARERSLSKEDIQELIREVKEIKYSPKNMNERKNYLAHFFLKLVDAHNSQKEREEPIENFIRVCNKYLLDKKFVFDDTVYSVDIKMDNGTNISLSDLSSGEKQIISLFSHVYLSGKDKFHIIIDEPELSLSLDWQKTFLTDIWNTRKCEFLGAVTHSPFIFDNDLFGYAMDMENCRF